MSENETYTDPRIINTHRAIREAFVDLLHEKTFAQIAVQDILDRAPVNRSTFYKYYSGKGYLKKPAPLFSGSPTTFRRTKPCNKKSVSKSKA